METISKIQSNLTSSHLVEMTDLVQDRSSVQGNVSAIKVTQPVGVFSNHTHTRFVAWAPNATQLELEIQHSDRTERRPMQKNEWGYWTTQVDKLEPGIRYGYRIDSNGPYPDPASCFQPEGAARLSGVVDSSYAWTDTQWKGLEIQQMIIYELHVGAFTTEGTLEAIGPKLDYLLELGINAIEILPVAQFSGSRGWGYDGVFPYAVQHSYGGPEALKKLVDSCHSKGIAVILDVVYNHLGPEGNCLVKYGPYLHSRYQQGWGDAINFDNKQADHVRSYFIDNALMWLRDYHIDGLRLDAVHSIWDFGATHFLAELSQAVKALSKQSEKNYVLIAESDLNDAKLLHPYSVGGFGLTAQWLDDFHHSLHSLATGEKEHYYMDFGALAHLQKAFEHTYVYNGTYSPFREKTFGSSAELTLYSQFVVYAQNHDQIGNRVGNDRIASLVSFPMLKVIAGTYLLSPYVPMLFMGEEYGETNPFFYFIDYSDQQLVEAVRTGRKEEFAGFQKDEYEYEDPQDVQTFARSRLSWDFQTEGRSELFNFYKRLIQIRKQHPAFANSERGSVRSWIENNQVLAWLQESTGAHNSAGAHNKSLLCVVCFDETEVEFTLPENQTWKLILDSGNILLDSGNNDLEQDQTVQQDQTGRTEKIILTGPHFMVWTSVDV